MVKYKLYNHKIWAEVMIIDFIWFLSYEEFVNLSRFTSKSRNQSCFFFDIYPIPLFRVELEPRVSVSIPTGMTSSRIVLELN